MSAIDFPNSPAVDSTFSAGANVWRWTGTVWQVVRVTPTGPTGATGLTGATGPTGATGSAGQFTAQANTPPASPIAGDAWFNTEDGAVYIYYDSYWVEVGTTEFGGATGPTGPAGGAGEQVQLVLLVGQLVRRVLQVQREQEPQVLLV